MDEKNLMSNLRKTFSSQGWALLIYSGIMNVMVIGVCTIDVVIRVLRHGGDADIEAYLIEAMLQNAWGYLLAVLISAAAMYSWKKKDFCLRQIWVPRKQMRGGIFFLLLCVFFSGQMVFQILAMMLEWFFNLFGLTIMGSIESATVQSDSLSMFLYMTLFAPVWEEILFRGLVLRTLEPYGKKFAILGSAFLFGIFHGNIVQSPYAFFVGLVLGYTAVEYSIGWAMLLHMLNNLVLGDMMNRLRMLMLGWVGDLLFVAVIWGFTLAAIIILIRRRREVAEYIRNGRMHPICLKAFFTAPGVLVLTVYVAANILFGLLMQIIA